MRQVLLWAALVMLSSGSALGQANGVGQLAELTASNGIPPDGFGLSVAVSGNVVVVGAPDANSNKGAVYVFVKPTTGWPFLRIYSSCIRGSWLLRNRNSGGGA